MASLLDHVTKQVNIIRAEKKKLKEKARARTPSFSRKSAAHRFQFSLQPPTALYPSPVQAKVADRLQAELAELTSELEQSKQKARLLVYIVSAVCEPAGMAASGELPVAPAVHARVSRG